MEDTKAMHYFGRFMYGIISTLYTSVFLSILCSVKMQGFAFAFAFSFTVHVFLLIESIKIDKEKRENSYSFSIIKRVYWLLMPLSMWVLILMKSGQNHQGVAIVVWLALSIVLYRSLSFLWSKNTIYTVEIFNRKLILYGKNKKDIFRVSLFDVELKISNPQQRLPGLNATKVKYRKNTYIIPVDIAGYYICRDTLMEQWEYAKLATR